MSTYWMVVMPLGMIVVADLMLVLLWDEDNRDRILPYVYHCSNASKCADMCGSQMDILGEVIYSILYK